MKIKACIPARLNSSRLPNKVLHKLDGKPMIQWVYERTLSAKGIDDVVILTDHQKVYDEAEKIGANVMMTSPKHQSGTDRLAEAAKSFGDTDVFVNIQGDQPFVEPEMIEQLIKPYLEGLNPQMTTLACPLLEHELKDPNAVKVAVNKKQLAMFFTRSEIPYPRIKQKSIPVYKHIGLYAYTKEALLNFTIVEPSALEQSEGLEQLRALEEGYSIYISNFNKSTIEINTLEDLETAMTMGLIHHYELYKP